MRNATYNFYIDPKQDELNGEQEIKRHWRKHSDHKIEITFSDEQSWELQSLKFIGEILSITPIFDSKLRIINNIKLLSASLILYTNDILMIY